MKNGFFNTETLNKAAIFFMTSLLLLSILPAIAQSSEQIHDVNQITMDHPIINNCFGPRGEESIYYYNSEDFWEYSRWSGTWYEAAIRLTPEELEEYEGYNLTAARVRQRDDNNHWYKLFIYDEGTDNSPGELLFASSFNFTQGQTWTRLDLPEPIELNVTRDIWISFYFLVPAQQYGVTTDYGPAVVGKGDWIRIENGEWQELRNMEYNGEYFDYNWNIEAIVEGEPIPEPELKIESIEGYPDCDPSYSLTAVVKNNGTGDATNINWNITVDGGFYVKEKKFSGTVETFLAGEEIVIHANITGIGLGIFFDMPTITIEVSALDVDEVEESVNAQIIFRRVVLQ